MTATYSSTTTMQGSSSRSRASPNVRRAPASKVSLSDGRKIDMPNADLTSIQGAHVVIELIKQRRALRKLLLSGNKLGDEGCEELFRFLSSDEGRRYKLEEIALNSNGIGDAGLEAISGYLRGNQYLKELSLQNNTFQGDRDVVYDFATAINSSNLRVLSIMNQHLSDPFLSVFLSALDSSSLRELQISSIGLTSDSTAVLIDFLTSRHCWGLVTLKCNNNKFGLRSIRAIVRKLEKDNFSLVNIELRENKPTRLGSFDSTGFHSTAGGSETEDSHDEEDIDSQDYQKMLKDQMDAIAKRNYALRKKVADQAISLLPYARSIFLRSSGRLWLESSSKPNFVSIHPSPDSPIARTSRNSFPFLTLPSELQQQIIHSLAPMLSSAQVYRIIEFASSIESQKLRGQTKCIPDPTTLLSFGPAMPKSNFCASGKCMGKGNSVFCHRYEERNQWLSKVRCDHFEPDGLLREDIMKYLSY